MPRPPTFAAAVRDGGGASEWLWKGRNPREPAEIATVLGEGTPTGRPLTHRLTFTDVKSRVEVVDEAIEELEPELGKSDVFFYYRFQGGHPAINIRNRRGRTTERHLLRDSLYPDQSVLAQRKDPDLYPEVTWVGRRYGAIQTYREWIFGRYAPPRAAQSTGFPEDLLLPDSRNLALVLNDIAHAGGTRFDDLLRRFFSRFERMSFKVSGNNVQLYLHETGFGAPIPATRLSDGTIRFVALLATLLSPSPPPIVCIEEPELGLHPDAVSLIADLLVEASERMQLVVTTHSDALVSALTAQPDAIIACERPGAGTQLRRLDPEKLASWLEEYRLGDLWRMGELGANP